MAGFKAAHIQSIYLPLEIYSSLAEQNEKSSANAYGAPQVCPFEAQLAPFMLGHYNAHMIIIPSMSNVIIFESHRFAITTRSRADQNLKLTYYYVTQSTSRLI
jgi:hypothetical protein